MIPFTFVSSTTRDAQAVYARSKLRSQEFGEGPIAFYHRPKKKPEQQFDKFECVNLLGFGVSGFGYLNSEDWAAQYYNYCNLVAEYESRIDQKELAIWRMGKYDQVERARRKVIFGLANSIS